MSDPIFISDSLTLQLPLSRCGCGPGLILVRPVCYATCQQNNETLDPEPFKKWAEESFTVAQITLDQSIESPLQDIEHAVQELIKQGCDGEKVGLIGKNGPCLVRGDFGLIRTVYGSKSDYAAEFEEHLRAVAERVAAVIFFDNWNVSLSVPTLFHSSTTKEKKDGQVLYNYADITGANFTIPGHPEFKISTAGVAHTRSVGFIKKHLGGPFFDLESIWDEHTYYEFGDRSVEKTMATMVQEPYVNHVPTVRAPKLSRATSIK